MCDAVRLSGPEPFIFASLTEDKGQFDLVVRSVSEEDKCLRLNDQVSKILSYTFVPDPASGVVMSTSLEQGGHFVSQDGSKFAWVCELRTSFAQRFVHRIAGNLSRIGLDEFEWQRRYAPRT